MILDYSSDIWSMDSMNVYIYKQIYKYIYFVFGFRFFFLAGFYFDFIFIVFWGAYATDNNISKPR